MLPVSEALYYHLQQGKVEVTIQWRAEEGKANEHQKSEIKKLHFIKML